MRLILRTWPPSMGRWLPKTAPWKEALLGVGVTGHVGLSQRSEAGGPTGNRPSC